jgi:hypothetical protein
MTTNDPIRLSDFRQAQAAAPVLSRQEAERQFKLSFALVMFLALGTLVAIATLPTGDVDGSGRSMHVASQGVLR